MAPNRRTGVIKLWFNGEDGYGFIHPDDGGQEIFVHHTGIAAARDAEAKPVSEGARVSYEVSNRGMGGRWAKNACEVASR